MSRLFLYFASREHRIPQRIIFSRHKSDQLCALVSGKTILIRHFFNSPMTDRNIQIRAGDGGFRALNISVPIVGFRYYDLGFRLCAG